MTECTGCKQEKPQSDFYESNRTRCKECVRKQVKENRLRKTDYYRAYDRKRGNRQPESYMKSWREKFPAKWKAQIIVGNAIRDGHLQREPCEVCGSDMSHAHHDDYFKPLAVRWLCAAHHQQWHGENGEASNARATIHEFNVFVYGLKP